MSVTDSIDPTVWATSVIPQAVLSDGLIVGDDNQASSIYTQKCDGWNLTTSNNVMARLDRDGRLFTRSYKIVVPFIGQFPGPINVTIVVHEFGPLVVMEVEQFGGAAATFDYNTIYAHTSMPLLQLVPKTMKYSTCFLAAVGDTSPHLGIVTFGTDGILNVRVLPFDSMPAASLKTIVVPTFTMTFDRRI